MQLTLLILSLQLAHTVCAGESLRHSENAGLRRRQSSSSLQAGQVQEEGVVRVSRKRARISSGLDERDVEEDDNREGSEDQIESRRGVRKGVRKTAKKEDGRGLLKQQILGRPGIADPVQISKEVDKTEPVRGRRVLKRKKGRQNISANGASKLEVQPTPQPIQASRHRFQTGRFYQRKQQTVGEIPLETVATTTTTVNPVLIWRQQAAVTEEPRGSGIRLRTGAVGGRGGSRRRKNYRRNKENSVANNAGEEKSSEVTKRPFNDTRSSNPRISFPSRINTFQSKGQIKDNLRGKFSHNVKDSKTSNKTFTRDHARSKGSQLRVETGRTSNLRQHMNTFSRGRSYPKDKQENLTLKPEIMLNKQKEVKIVTGNLKEASKSNGGFSPKDEKVEDFKIDRRVNHQWISPPISKPERDFVTQVIPRRTIHPSKSLQIPKLVPSHSRSSITTSVTSSSFSVTHAADTKANKEEITHQKVNRKGNIEHVRELPSRRRGLTSPRRSNIPVKPKISSQGSTVRVSSTTSHRRDKTLGTIFNPRTRSRGNAFLDDSGVANDTAMISTEKVTIASNVIENKKKVKQELQRLPEKIPATPEPITINRISTDQHFPDEENTRKILKTENVTKKERMENAHEPALSENINNKYRFKLESGRAHTVDQKDALNRKYNSLEKGSSIHQNGAIVKSRNLPTVQVDRKLKQRFSPRRRNKGSLSNSDIVKSSKSSGNSIKAPTNTNQNRLIRTQMTTSRLKLKNQKAVKNKAAIDKNTAESLKHEENRTKGQAESIIVLDVLKTPLEITRSETKPLKKIKSLAKKSRRGPVTHIAAKQNSQVSEKEAPIRYNQRFRQRFSSRKEISDKDSGSNIVANQSQKTRNILTLPTSAKQLLASHTPANAAPDKYFDIAFKHAEVTWAQDPFRRGSTIVEGPQFDIDYTKDPNYNSDDNEGPVETFSNFGQEESSIKVLPTNPVSLPTIHRGRKQPQESSPNENIKLRDFESVSSESFGSFSAADPVFVPLFTPDLTRQEPEDSPLFEPFSFSINL